MDTPTPSSQAYRPRRQVRPPWRARLALLGRRVLRASLMVVAVVLVVDALFGDKGLLQTLRARRRYADLAASLDRLRRENAQLREEARRLREDPGAIEEMARRDLGLRRRGELVFIVKDGRPRADGERRPREQRP